MIDDLKRLYNDNKELSLLTINVVLWFLLIGFIAPPLVSAASTFLVIVGFVLVVLQTILVVYYFRELVKRKN